jgi:RNA polymerase sigma factor (sigma-70 family)
MDAAITLPNNMQKPISSNITQVVNHYSKRLLGFIRKRVGNEADAQDILQDVFYQFVGNTQPIEQLTAWLFRVARNRITDVQRKKKPLLIDDTFTATDDENDALGDWKNLLLDDSNNPETDYLRQLFWETLHNALNELPEEQKQVFVLNELEDIPYKQIAEITGASQSALLSRKRYAVLHLRKRLQTLKNELLTY